MRIVQATDDDGAVVLGLNGQMRGRWVDELRSVSSEILRQPATRLILDLAEISFIDDDGLELLRELLSPRVTVRHCSLFVAQQLKALEGKP